MDFELNAVNIIRIAIYLVMAVAAFFILVRDWNS